MIIGINPYLMLDGKGKEAVDFYEYALDATVVSVRTYGDIPGEQAIPEALKGRILHAHIKIGQTDMMIADTFPGPQQSATQPGNQLSIAVSIASAEKTREVYGKLLEGGQELMPLQETFFSPLYGQVTDKFGVTWQVFTIPEQG